MFDKIKRFIPVLLLFLVESVLEGFNINSPKQRLIRCVLFIPTLIIMLIYLILCFVGVVIIQLPFYVFTGRDLLDEIFG